MPYIIVKGSLHKEPPRDWQQRKDFLHKRRKEIEADLRSTIFTKDQMNMVDCKDEASEERRVVDYDGWKMTKDKIGKTNEDKLREFNEINREFKKHGEEGRVHSSDDLRNNKPIKYD